MGINNSSFKTKQVICGVKYHVDTKNDIFEIIGYYTCPNGKTTTDVKYKKIMEDPNKTVKGDGRTILDITNVEDGYFLNNIITESKDNGEMVITLQFVNYKGEFLPVVNKFKMTNKHKNIVKNNVPCDWNQTINDINIKNNSVNYKCQDNDFSIYFKYIDNIYIHLVIFIIIIVAFTYRYESRDSTRSLTKKEQEIGN